VEVSKAVTDVKIGKTGFAFLVDDSGKVLAHGQQGKIKEVLQDFRAHPALKQTAANGLSNINDDGKPVIAYTMDTNMGWKLVVQQDEAEAFASLQDAQRNALVLLVLAFGMVGLLAFLSARGLTKSLRELTVVADGYSRGELNATIPGTQRSDEIGALARAVERLGISIKIAFETLSRR
jgi:methyl-accepting chemotaxis protein